MSSRAFRRIPPAVPQVHRSAREQSPERTADSEEGHPGCGDQECDQGGDPVRIVSRVAAPGFLVYCATKGGIDALTRALAVELGPHRIKVNAISPGLVRSEIYFNDNAMTEAEYENYLAEYGKSYPLGRTGEPAEVSALVSFLASEEASWMTGDVISVDGGGLAS